MSVNKEQGRAIGPEGLNEYMQNNATIFLHGTKTNGSVLINGRRKEPEDMKDSVRKLKAYLSDLGIQGAEISSSVKILQKLPVYLSNMYDAYEFRMLGKEYYLLHIAVPDRPTPAALAKHAEKAQASVLLPIIFLIDSAPAYERQRLIQKGIAFVVPKQHLYIPMVFMDIRENHAQVHQIADSQQKSISTPAQMLLLSYLLDSRLNALSLNQWAQRLRYSPASLTRVRKELESSELCQSQGKGKAITLHFSNNLHSVWTLALPFLQSPVRNRKNCRALNIRPSLLIHSGVSALSRRSMISADTEQCYAMSSSAYDTAIEEGQLQEQSLGEPDTVIVERWRYAPGILSASNDIVDDLSLYLSLRGNPDERIQGALSVLLEDMPW